MSTHTRNTHKAGSITCPKWSVVTLLLHSCHTVVTLLSHCWYTVGTVSLQCCHAVVTLLLHSCCTLVTLLLLCCYRGPCLSSRWGSTAHKLSRMPRASSILVTYYSHLCDITPTYLLHTTHTMVTQLSLTNCVSS
jgi:hypothetical protein